MYFILPIALAFFLLAWFLLRKYTQVWINRPINVFESIVAGIAAWVFIVSILLWFAGIVLTTIDFLSSHDTEDIWALLFAALLTGYALDFLVRSRVELRIDETQEFLKEALQFRRSAQRRTDLIELMKQRRTRKNKSATSKDPETIERERLQKKLSKEKELEIQLNLLKGGKSIDISDIWRARSQEITENSFFKQTQEARIDPNRKRLAIVIDFPEYNETKLHDEVTILRFNRQAYDFMQYLNSEPILKPYAKYFESYYLLCRATRINQSGEEIYYPFIKIGMLISDLRKLEGSYFNPRKFSEIATVAFNNGAAV